MADLPVIGITLSARRPVRSWFDSHSGSELVDGEYARLCTFSHTWLCTATCTRQLLKIKPHEVLDAVGMSVMRSAEHYGAGRLLASLSVQFILRRLLNGMQRSSALVTG
jgi:hypothetical protein